MKKLAILIGNRLSAYLKKGLTEDYLKEYYNPKNFFDEVYLLSSVEKTHPNLLGMQVINTKRKNIKKLIKKIGIDVVRAYSGSWSCDKACLNKVTGVPVVVSVHSTNPLVLHNSVKRADIVFCVSDAIKDLVLKKYKNQGLLRWKPAIL